MVGVFRSERCLSQRRKAMKKMNRILRFLLALTLCLSLAACALGSGGETEPVVYVPATQPDYSDETTAPIYTRPGEDGEDEDITLENPDGSDDTDSPDGGDSNTGTGTGSTGGSTGDTTDSDSGDAFADGGVTSNAQGSAKPLSWDNINAFPIKSSNMSVAEMRKLCVDFFRYAKTALWTPDVSIKYIKNAKGTADSMTGGQLYGGLPYVGNASGNIYRLMDYMNSSGKVNMSDMLGTTTGTLTTTDLRYFGNQCANGVAVGWCRVINTVSKHYTAGITPASGYVMLGSYTKDADKLNSIENWSTDYGTDEFCKANGEQVMFAGYAKLQMGDGLVYYTTAGHVIMAATDAHVEYVPGTNTIDGDKSYITIIDQAQAWETQTAANGSKYQVKSSVDAKVTFRKLYNSNYVPFTFKEFLGQDPVEATSVSFSHTDGTITKSQLFGGTVTCNYGITDAYAIVKDASGKEVYRHAVRNSTAWGKTLKMAETGAKVDSWGSLPTSGTYTVELLVQLGTGERPTVYSGQLTISN